MEEAADIMSEQAIRRLPVLDVDHRLVGIVSVDDLVTNQPQDGAELFPSVSDVERPGARA
jgi:CBS domain-containing protein